MPPSIPGTISTLQIAPKVAAFDALGLDTERILGLAQLPRERFADADARLPAETEFALWEAAIAVTGDPALGLRVAQHMRTGAFGGYEYLLRNSASLQQAFERADRYMRLIDDLARITVEVRGELVTTRLFRMGGHAAPPADVECLFAFIAGVLKAELPAARLSAVHFAHRAATALAPYEQHFECPVRFEQPAYELLFPASMLALAPTRRADPELGRVLEEHAKLLLSKMPELDPFLQAARSEMLQQLRQERLTPSNLARALHLSERTLRRRLQAHGTGYQPLLDSLRAELAQQYVAQTREPFDVIAGKLAFADASAFFRAFKRWTGTTPAQFRARSEAR